MDLLVLGGTQFLSRAVAEVAVERGHEVTCACRGLTERPPAGTRHLPLDRESSDLSALAGGRFDAVVDVARRPSFVRSAVRSVPDAHWVFVSTINVYEEIAERGAAPEDLPLLPPVDVDGDPTASPEAYGSMKVACEALVREGTRSWTIVRPGLIVGPGDPSGRFTYWPNRLSGPAGEVLAPGRPEDSTQVIDVRDLAAWIVTLAEQETQGVLHGVGPSRPLADVLGEIATGCGVAPDWRWVPQEFLQSHDVEPWSGERSIPLWLPRPEYDGFTDVDVSASVGAGLRVRPIEETARDTLAWLRDDPDVRVTGLTVQEEKELLEIHRHGGA